MHRYVHLTVVYASPEQDPRLLEPAVGSAATDWVRYSTNSWVLWTRQSLATITATVRSRLAANDNVIALSLHPHETPAGFMPAWVWEWFNRQRDPETGNVHWPPPPPPPPPPSLARPLPPPAPNALQASLFDTSLVQPSMTTPAANSLAGFVRMLGKELGGDKPK